MRISARDKSKKYTVKDAGKKGRGLFATQPIKKGEKIFVAEINLISASDWTLLEQCQKESPDRNLIDLYKWQWGDEHAAVLGDIDYLPNAAEKKILKDSKLFPNDVKLHEFNFINHSDIPNVKEEYGHTEIIMTALKDIAEGEEIVKEYYKGWKPKTSRDHSSIVISAREISAYIGQGPASSPVTYPPSIMTPWAADPEKYGDVANIVNCSKCDVKLIKTEDPETGKEVVICPECGSRYSSKDFHRDYSSYSMNPSTLNVGFGANVNNEAQGVSYHGPVELDVPSQRWGK